MSTKAINLRTRHAGRTVIVRRVDDTDESGGLYMGKLVHSPELNISSSFAEKMNDKMYNYCKFTIDLGFSDGTAGIIRKNDRIEFVK